MNNEYSSIHDFDVNLISEYFSGVERQGPGSPEVTLKALGFVGGLSPQSLIADLGCGTGGQTMTLALNAPGKITGIDIFPRFIERFNENAHGHGVHDRVKGIIGSMGDLPFQREELDLIWSEGAIYNIGFERGLNEWRPYLKTGGYLAVSEASWLTEKRPEEIDRFWVDAYPEIDLIAVKTAQMQKAGYTPVAIFVLPEDCWTAHYFLPQVPRQEEFLEKYKGDKVVETFVKNLRREAKLYDQYKEHYGYVFYIGKKI